MNLLCNVECMSFMLKDRDKSKHKEPEEATLSSSNIDSDKGKT